MFVESVRARHTQRAGKQVRVPATPDSKWRLKKKQLSTDKIEVKSMTETQLTIDSDTYYYETLLPMQGGRLPGITTCLDWGLVKDANSLFVHPVIIRFRGRRCPAPSLFSNLVYQVPRHSTRSES
jgi:hypothetical protein